MGATAAGVLAALALALAAGVSASPAALAIVALSTATSAAAARVATSSVDDPLALCASDLKELPPGGETSGDDAAGFDPLATFYRSSTLIGLLVGASFIFSPVSPIAIFDTEAALTHSAHARERFNPVEGPCEAAL